jgi:hypothetical protein
MRRSHYEHRVRREKLAILTLFIGTALITCSAPALAMVDCPFVR